MIVERYSHKPISFIAAIKQTKISSNEIQSMYKMKVLTFLTLHNLTHHHNIHFLKEHCLLKVRAHIACAFSHASSSQRGYPDIPREGKIFLQSA